MNFSKLFIFMVFTSLLSCNDDSSKKTPATFVDTANLKPINTDSTSINVKKNLIDPDDIYDIWGVQLMHIKNSCSTHNGESSGAEQWKIWSQDGKIKVAEMKSLIVMKTSHNGVLKDGVLEIYDEYEDIISKETFVIQGKIEFLDKHHFEGSIKEKKAQGCITTYKVYGSK